MANDLYETILQAALAVVQNLTFSGLDPANIQGRELPKASETLDPLPLLVVCPSERQEDAEPLSAEDNAAYEIMHWVDVIFIAGGQHDFASQRKTWLRYREQIRRAFQQSTLDGVPQVFDTVIRPTIPLPRSLLNQSYAYSGCSVGFKTVEQRTN